MTIDEAIEHCAEWLEELKELRKFKETYQKGMDYSYATFMYNKAIDDFEDKILSYLKHDDYGNAMDILVIADELKKERCRMKDFEIKVSELIWNDNFSEIAQEDFSLIQKDLPYSICQTIGMALAKLELLEKQGCKVKESVE